jgi:hypothetical protein
MPGRGLALWPTWRQQVSNAIGGDGTDMGAFEVQSDGFLSTASNNSIDDQKIAVQFLLGKRMNLFQS